jgi:hypothetical protein
LKPTPLSPNPFLLGRVEGEKFKVFLHFDWFWLSSEWQGLEWQGLAAPSFPLPRGKELRIGVCFSKWQLPLSFGHPPHTRGTSSFQLSTFSFQLLTLSFKIPPPWH